MNQKIPYITLIESPFGYGKTFKISNLSNSYKILNVKYLHQNDNFINSLINSFHINKFDCPISSQEIDWYKYFKHLKYDLLLIFDDFDKINDDKAKDFINFFISNKANNIKFILSSSTRLELVKNINLLDDCKYINQIDLCINELYFKELFKENKLKLSKVDLEFLDRCNGWSIAVNFYLQLKIK